MPTYLELKQQAEELMAQAGHLRQQEKRSVIAGIKRQIQEYGITGQELGLTQTRAATSTKRSPAGVKYRNSDGQAWSGRGRKPKWLAAALAAGRSLGDFTA